MTAVASTAERYREAWQEAATDAELAFDWWIGATVLDQRCAAIGYFAALEREERAALAYEDAWNAWRTRRARDQAGSAAKGNRRLDVRAANVLHFVVR
jgi:hypothetical protein